ncbi:MAG: reverse transcriptase/maturase family protein [bacterium]
MGLIPPQTGMKRFKNLYPQIHCFENLLLAARRAQHGKRFKPEVAAFNFDQENELFRLQRDLRDKIYQHGQYRHFPVFEGKKRIISCSPYRDRGVHHALCNVIEPIFERAFIYDSYACRKGKGTHAAVDRLTFFSRKNRYALKIDIRKYFPSVRHDILLNLLERKIGDGDVLWLIREIIDSHQATPAADSTGNLLLPFDGPRGIPIGNQTSQFFANVYLNELDHFVKEQLHCKAYIRYVDDMVYLHSSKVRLNDIREKIRSYLEDRLHLTMHEERSHVFPVAIGIDFLGYQVFPTHRRIRDGNGYRFARRLNGLREGFRSGEKTLFEVGQSMVSWIGHVSHGDSWGLRTALLSEVVF